MPRSDIIRKAIALGRDKGFVTFGELNEVFSNELLPSTTTSPEYIEAVLMALNDEGINVIEGDDP